MIIKYKSYNIKNLESIPFFERIDKSLVDDMKIVGDIYPFKTNNYVLENLIDWDNFLDDPIFRLNFPHKGMLTEKDYDKLKWAKSKLNPAGYAGIVNEVRLGLNPHPAGQSTINVPFFDEMKLEGIQHKYKNTILFFPSHGQTCHAFCTFCFRWPQFVSELDLKFQAKEIAPVINYLKANRNITDILITGGDPMTMNSKVLLTYIEPLLKIDSLKTIRIGTKSLSFWPYKFTTDADAEDILNVLKKIVDSKKHLAIMAHFNHPVELGSETVQAAIHNLKCIGAEIRTQAPLLRNINDREDVWAALWQRQVELGCVPYYMFLVRDTGAQHYFSIELKNALQLYRKAIVQVSGLARTVKGPVMSVLNGKVELLDIKNERYMLRYLQHRHSELAYQVFYGCAHKGQPVSWFNELQPETDNDQKYFR